jgi:hypothetical protein
MSFVYVIWKTTIFTRARNKGFGAAEFCAAVIAAGDNTNIRPLTERVLACVPYHLDAPKWISVNNGLVGLRVTKFAFINRAG